MLALAFGKQLYNCLLRFYQGQHRQAHPRHARFLEELSNLCHLLSPASAQYSCPLCNYFGPFVKLNDRIDSRCPSCNSLERHRLQSLVLRSIESENYSLSQLEVLHVSPDPILSEMFKKTAKYYLSIDLNSPYAMVQMDLTNLGLPDNSFDIVFCSHVLEHILDDATALKEINRVLRPSGLAILTVPIFGENTEEFGEAREEENYHVRRPGKDYFNRYKKEGFQVSLFSSRDFESEGVQLSLLNGGCYCSEEIIAVCYKPEKQKN
ncbi:MAG: class I SAM-dependent methyltransferase [Nitrospira sp.]|nr:class I SAM-dependent methyltransferase [Nitrospira sp.]